jgi:hypothetical protein
VVRFFFVWIDGLLAFLQFLQPPPNALVRSTDDIYTGDFVWSFLLEFVQGAEGVDAEGVCATEEDAEGVVVFGCTCA